MPHNLEARSASGILTCEMLLENKNNFLIEKKKVGGTREERTRRPKSVSLAECSGQQTVADASMRFSPPIAHRSVTEAATTTMKFPT